MELSFISRPYWQNQNEIEEEIRNNSELQKIITKLTQNPDSNGNYTLENDKLHYKGKLVLSANSIWIPILLQKFHQIQYGFLFCYKNSTVTVNFIIKANWCCRQIQYRFLFC